VNIGNELAYPFADKLVSRGVPTIFVTGYQANAIDARFKTTPVLTKPIETEDLLAALSGVLNRAPLQTRASQQA